MVRKQLFSLWWSESLLSHSPLQFSQYLLSNHCPVTLPTFAQVLQRLPFLTAHVLPGLAHLLQLLPPQYCCPCLQPGQSGMYSRLSQPLLPVFNPLHPPFHLLMEPAVGYVRPSRPFPLLTNNYIQILLFPLSFRTLFKTNWLSDSTLLMPVYRTSPISKPD